ncbi:MAG: HlyC/CorC family transporter [Gammaproteobacteria bacterium]
MSEERPNQSQSQRTWFDKLSQVLSGEPKDKEHLIDILRESQQRHLFDTDALSMIEGVLEVSEMQVRDIMIPRAQMVVVEHNAGLEKVLPVITEFAHSRYPVITENKDEVVGILLAKDLLGYALKSDDEPFNVRDILRPAVFIPESKRLNVLLKEFRSSRNHMAIVVDEYGCVAGLVTIEDVLEQIVGEIADEHDVDDDIYIMKHSDSNYTVKALTPIDDFNEMFNTDFSDDEFDTIGGLVMREFGYLPKRGEVRSFGDLRFKVLHADSRRVHLLQLTMLSKASENLNAS